MLQHRVVFSRNMRYQRLFTGTGGGLDGRPSSPQCRLSILRNANVPSRYLLNSPVDLKIVQCRLSILRKAHVRKRHEIDGRPWRNQAAHHGNVSSCWRSVRCGSCLFRWTLSLTEQLFKNNLTYNKRKTSLRYGMTVNTHWWFRDIPHSPFGLVWDVPEPPARIYRHPTSSAGFPLLPTEFDIFC